MKVLVATESTADDRKTLAAVRALGRNGIHVTVGGDALFREPFASRYCKTRLRYPEPFGDLDGFVTKLEQIMEARHFDVVLPLSDYITIPLSMNRSRFEKFARIPVVEYDTLAIAHDKWRSGEAARSAGIDTPATYLPESIEEVMEIAKDLQYPCVLKPRKGAGASGLKFPASAQELVGEFSSLQHESDQVFDNQPIIQEYIPGQIHDVCLLFNRGKVRAALTQKRIRMYPAGGGVGIYNETTDEPELQDKAIALLESLNWHGPALVEFKVHADTGIPYFIEANTRYWGTLDLAIQAGVDFPTLACRMAVDGDVEPVFSYKVGLRYKWVIPFGFLYAAGQDNRWPALWEFLRREPGTRSDIRLTDPLPLFVKTLLAIKNHC